LVDKLAGFADKVDKPRIHLHTRKAIMNKIIATAVKAYSSFERAVSHSQTPLLLAVRLYWGWQFSQTGLGKLMNIDKTVDFFTSLGIPFPALNAYFVGSLECIGGALLFLGLGSRIIALPLTINMLVAYLTADREALFSIFSDPGKFYAADPFTFFFASLLILVFGPGKISLDAAINYLRKRGVQAQDQRQLSAVLAGHREQGL
jgi:putative oxidoreductase